MARSVGIATASSDVPAGRLRELGGVSVPADLFRTVGVDGTVVLARAMPSDDADVLREIATQHRWRLVDVADPDAASWATNIQKTSLVLVVGPDPAFTLGVLKAIRRSTSAPAVAVGLSNSGNRVSALREGADLVLPGGLSSDELHAHLVAVLRRATETWEPTVRYLTSGQIQVDLWSRTCIVAGRPVELSPVEFQLLVYLMHHAHQAIPAHKIVQRVWHNWGYTEGLNTLRIHVSRLRRKLSIQPEIAGYIRSIRGLGYEFTQSVLQIGDGTGEQNSQPLNELGLSSLILDIARTLQTQPIATAAEYVVEALTSTVGCDASAMFHQQGDRMVLVAERGNSDRWREAMRDGIPLESGYAQVHALQTAQPTQIADISTMSPQYASTAEILSRDGFRSCLFLPIVTHSGPWGGLGLASRASRPFDATMTTFCSAVASLFSLAVRGSNHEPSDHTIVAGV
jgi:DNA-binding response OmpR family regulator